MEDKFEVKRSEATFLRLFKLGNSIVKVLGALLFKKELKIYMEILF